MTVRVPACLLAAFVVGGLVVSPSRADDDPGQEDLDQAIAAKLSADSFRALGSVADLCQSEIDKGLAAPNLEAPWPLYKMCWSENPSGHFGEGQVVASSC